MAIATPARPAAASHRSADGDYAAGDLIGAKYRLVSPIGEGGMGTVWLARNTTLHADVAVKLVRREIAGSDEAAQRLLTEARAAAQLEHPSIVKVHDFGETDRGDPYIVMELLKGEALDEMVDRVGPLTPTAAAQILLPVLSALIVVHEKGIVHRDIKPDNIILVADGAGDLVPKLVDFGIARLQYRTVDVDESHDSTPGRRVTQMGHILGSPEFMSPEQARGDHNVDGRSDLWSIVVVLYHTMTGALPFVEDDVEKTLLAILAGQPTPLSQHGVDDPALSEIVERGLQKRVDHRWQDAHSLGRALAQWLQTRDVYEDVTGRPLHKQWGSQRPGPLRASSYPSVPVARSSNPPVSSPPSFDGRPSGPSFPPPARVPSARHTDPSWLSHDSTLNDALAKSTPPPPRRTVGTTIAVGVVMMGVVTGVAMLSISETPSPPAAAPTSPAATTTEAVIQTASEPDTEVTTEPVASVPGPSASAAVLRPPAARPVRPPPDPTPETTPEVVAPPPKARSGSMPLPDDADF